MRQRLPSVKGEKGAYQTAHRGQVLQGATYAHSCSAHPKTPPLEKLTLQLCFLWAYPLGRGHSIKVQIE